MMQPYRAHKAWPGYARLMLAGQRCRILDIANDAAVAEVELRREIELNGHAEASTPRGRKFPAKRGWRGKKVVRVPSEQKLAYP